MCPKTQVSKCPQVWVDDPIWTQKGTLIYEPPIGSDETSVASSAVKSADLPSLFVKYEPKDNSYILKPYLEKYGGRVWKCWEFFQHHNNRCAFAWRLFLKVHFCGFGMADQPDLTMMSCEWDSKINFSFKVDLEVLKLEGGKEKWERRQEKKHSCSCLMLYFILLL